MTNFNEFTPLTEREEITISEIVARAQDEIDIDLPTVDTFMDIHAAHSTCQLDLDKLHQFDRFNFIHDVTGIIHHLNRETGELEGCFLPRSAKPMAAT